MPLQLDVERGGTADEGIALQTTQYSGNQKKSQGEGQAMDDSIVAVLGCTRQSLCYILQLHLTCMFRLEMAWCWDKLKKSSQQQFTSGPICVTHVFHGMASTDFFSEVENKDMLVWERYLDDFCCWNATPDQIFPLPATQAQLVIAMEIANFPLLRSSSIWTSTKSCSNMDSTSVTCEQRRIFIMNSNVLRYDSS